MNEKNPVIAQRRAEFSALAHDILGSSDLPSGTEIDMPLLEYEPIPSLKANTPIHTVTLPNGMIFDTKYHHCNLRMTLPDGQILYYKSGGEEQYPFLRNKSYFSPGTYLKVLYPNTTAPSIFFHGSKELNKTIHPTDFHSDKVKLMTNREGKLFIKKQIMIEHSLDPAERAEILAQEEKKAALYRNIFKEEFSGAIVRERMLGGQPVTIIETVLPFKGKSLAALMTHDVQPLTLEERVKIAKRTIQQLCLLHEGRLSHNNQPITHGHLNLEHVCVNQDTLEVSLVGHASEYQHIFSEYTAPELRDPDIEKRQFSPQADIYALGVILRGYSYNELKAQKGRKTTKYDRLFTTEQGLLLNINQEEWEQADEHTRMEYRKLFEMAGKMIHPDSKKRPELEDLKIACGLSSHENVSEIVKIIQQAIAKYNAQENSKNFWERFLKQNHIELPKTIKAAKNIGHLRMHLQNFCEQLPVSFSLVLQEELSSHPQIAQVLNFSPKVCTPSPSFSDSDDEYQLNSERSHGQEDVISAQTRFKPVPKVDNRKVVPMDEDHVTSMCS